MKIDELMPAYDVRTRHRVQVRASPEEVWSALVCTDFSDSFLVRILMSVRSGRMVQRQGSKPIRERLAGTGFLELAEVPGQEVVLGIAGRFWRPDGGRCFDVDAGEFPGFHRAGYAKAVWNFALLPNPGGCQLSTETRVQCFGRAALVSFRAYWTVVKPFSGLIRRAILQQVKRAAESGRTRAASP
ncbi:MAG TPA: hypothetical protein VMS96_08380 [Terriglobales bacterium]|nr:hypothetical protein [Terriglobales bacterium]